LTQARRYVAEAARADDFGTAHGIDEASAVRSAEPLGLAERVDRLVVHEVCAMSEMDGTWRCTNHTVAAEALRVG
jgi:hypothetical protein